MNTTTAHHPLHRRLALLLILTTASVGLPKMAGAQVVAPVPSVINYQGRVTDATGLPIGATGTAAAPVPGVTNRKIIFRIYDAATGGTRLWTEEQTVTIANGEFSVLLGSGINATGTAAGESRPALDTVFTTLSSPPGTARYLEVMVDEGGGNIDGGDAPISPRQQLTTTAYSFRAKSADSIASGTDLQLNGSSNYGLGYYGTGRTFNGAALNGPVLYGQGGGALGVVNGATQSTALRWDASNAVTLGGALTGTSATFTNLFTASGGVAANGASGYVFTAPGDMDGGLFSPADGTVTIKTNNTERMRVGSNGNVGIGTTAPGAKLHIGGSYGFFGIPTIAAQTAVAKTSTSTTEALALATSDVANPFGVTFRLIGAAALANRSVALQTGDIDSADGGNLSLQYQGGNVGIGTASPSFKLDVAGNIYGSLIVRPLGSYQNGSIYSDDNYGMLFRSARANPTLATFSFANTSDAKIMTMLDGGNVGIGTTTPPHKLSVRNGNFYQDAASGWQDAFIIARDGVVRAGLAMDVSGTSLNLYTGPSVVTPRMTITASGNVGIGTTAPNSNYKLQVRSTTNPVTGWDGGGAFGGGSFNTVLGQLDGVAQIAGHNGALNAWANLAINSGGGNVGIGTASPTKAKLQVNGSVDTSSYLGGFLNISQASVVNGTETRPFSIWASNDIIAQNVYAFSDGRIKNIEGRSDSAADLATLGRIEITDYKLKDVIVGHGHPNKKVIAQQVEKVYPQAVSRSTDVVPDIYKKGMVRDGWVELKTNLKKGERVRLIAEKAEGIHEVLEVADGRFRTAFKPAGAEVFVYGREVKDFRQVDYDAISMLNVSATQELARKLEVRDADVAELRKKNDALQVANARLAARLAELEAKDKAREARLVAIEKLLLSADQPAVRTASLKGAGAE